MSAKRLACDSDEADMSPKRLKREDTMDCKPDLVPIVQHWSLKPSAVPVGTKKIYVIIRGRSPGFYFDWAVAEPQCRGFSSALFQSFPQGKQKIKADNLEQVVHDAVAYMNHDSRNCKYSCLNTSNCVQPPQIAQIAQNITQDVSSTVLRKKRDRRSCRACGKLPLIGQQKICSNCPELHTYLTNVRSYAQKFDLCDEQADLLELIALGDNVFFTGPVK